MNHAANTECRSATGRDQVERPAHCFTWERPEYAGCEHKKLGSVIAVKADGTKLAVCENCSILTSVKRSKSAPHPKVGAD
jgi:hypothetical protein